MTDGQLTGRGMAVTLGGILLFEVMSQTVIKLPTLTVLTILVGWAGFAGGLRTGFLSATLTSMYAVYFFSTPGQLFSYTPENGLRLLAFTLASAAIATMTGVLRATTLRSEAALRNQLEFTNALNANLGEGVYATNSEGASSL